MAFLLVKKICSLFYHQPTKREEAHSIRTIDSVFGNWAGSIVQDLPPPYTYSPEKKTYLQDEKHSPPPPFTCARLQICPHETLSYEGLQKTANTIAIGNPGETINALTPGCHEHRFEVDPSAQHVCISSPSLLQGFGTYASEASKDPLHTPGVLLSFHWDVGCLDSLRAQVESAAELQHFVSADGIGLCPHKRISDSDIVNAIYGFVKRSSGREVTTGCERCDTEIKITKRMEGGDETCRVTTKRHLGTLMKANDPQWLAQCGV